jgi:succinate dehydrogenase hydrophobic anchor subunit
MATRIRENLTEAATPPQQRPRPAVIWMAQVVSGVLLLVLMTVHMVAQHFVVAGACGPTRT